MIRYGILSTANIADKQVLPAMQLATNSLPHAIASRKLAKARKLAERNSVPLSFGSYEALLEHDEIDAVYIPLPTGQHVEWTEKAIKAGKHVLCEKPIALKAGSIKRLIRARDKAGVVVSEAFMVTYHPQWQKVRDLLARGTIGRLRHIEGSFSYFNRDPKNTRNQPDQGGGALPDIGVYPVVCARFATGEEPESLTAAVEFDPDFHTDRYAHASVQFKSFDLNFYVATQLANRQSMVFHGDKGFIELSAPFNSNLYEGDELRVHNVVHKETRVFRYTGVNQYCLQVEAFSDAILTGKTPVFSLEDSMKNQQVIDAIYKAGASGRRVRVTG